MLSDRELDNNIFLKGRINLTGLDDSTELTLKSGISLKQSEMPHVKHIIHSRLTTSNSVLYMDIMATIKQIYSNFQYSPS